MMKNLKSIYNASAIIDNNILIDLFELGSIELLFKVFDTIAIPKSIIQDELDERIRNNLMNMITIFALWIQLKHIKYILI